MVRAAQKGELENPSPEVSKIASTVSKSDVKKMASTKHKGLPEKKPAEVNETTSLVSVLHKLKEEGYPARREGPQKGLGTGLCPVCGQFGCTKDHDAEKEEQVDEAKVDTGTPEEKEKARNVRKFGVSHNVAGHGKLRRALHRSNRGDKKIKGDKSQYVETESMQYEAKVDKGIPDYKRATKRDERYGNPHGSLALGGGIRKDRRADHEARRGVKKEEVEMTRKAYNKLHKDFKSDDPKNPRTTKYVPGKGTVSMPVKFVDEEVGLEEERSARKMNVRTKKTIGATIEKNAAAEAKRRANKTGEYAEKPKKKRSLKKPSQLTRVVDSPKPAPKPKAAKKTPVTKATTTKPAPKPKAKKVTPKKTPITKATVTKPEPKKKSTKKPAAMKKAVERKKEVIKQPEKKAPEKKTGTKSFKDFYKQGVKRHRKATQAGRVFAKGAVQGAKKAVKFAKDVKKAVVGEEYIVENKVKKVASMIKNLRKKPDSLGKKPSMDKITTKLHTWRKDKEKDEKRKYVNDIFQ